MSSESISKHTLITMGSTARAELAKRAAPAATGRSLMMDKIKQLANEGQGMDKIEKKTIVE